MGIYINPENGMTKEKWVATHGKRIEPPSDFANVRRTGAVPVCVVDNYIFTAAAICYDQAETDAFLSPDDRDKTWWTVPISALRTGSGVTEREIAMLESRV